MEKVLDEKKELANDLKVAISYTNDKGIVKTPQGSRRNLNLLDVLELSIKHKTKGLKVDLVVDFGSPAHRFADDLRPTVQKVR